MLDFLLREWLLVASASGLLLSILFLGRLPSYSPRELEVLLVLWALFICGNGLQQSGVLERLALGAGKNRRLALQCIGITFFLSMFITNDLALIITVPLTLSLPLRRKDLLVILEIIAANAGSAFTPMGNPQNFYLYWFYQLNFLSFLKTMFPLAAPFFFLLGLAGLFLSSPQKSSPTSSRTNFSARKASFYICALVWVFLIVIRLLPPLGSLLIVAGSLALDRKSLRVDYTLLLTFFFFFGLSTNMGYLFRSHLHSGQHMFWLSVLASQLMSNVPAALLLAKFTPHWQPLLWGVNAGGFGSPVGSLANLIGYKLYLNSPHTQDRGKFTLLFLILNYLALLLAIGLYFLTR